MTENYALIQKEKAELISAIANLESQKKQIEKQEESMREQLLAAMENYGVLGIDNDVVSITYIPSGERKSLDTARLKKDFPGLAEQYTKTSAVKANLRIKVK